MEPVKPQIIIAARSFVQRVGIKTILGILGLELDITEATNYQQLITLVRLPNTISHLILDEGIFPNPQKNHFDNFMEYSRGRKVLILCEQCLEQHEGVGFLLHEKSSDRVLEVFRELFIEPEETDQADWKNIALSAREIDVLKQVAQGYSNKEIAESLYISVNTVITHRKNITDKLGIKTIAGLTVYAIMNNLISPDRVKP
jgi:DNA-binding CsgD family transcriptional regulator